MIMKYHADIEDLYPLTYIIPALYVVHEIFHRAVFPRLGDWLVAKDTQSSEKVRAGNRAKTASAGWNFFTHGSMLVLGMWALWGLEWPGVGRELYEHHTQHALEPRVRFLYQYSLAMYTVDFFFLFWKPKQKDFWQMVFHHICTLFLIGGSFFSGFHRVGAVIMFLHDVSDPIMEIAKMFLYAGKSRMADALFGGFAAVFLISRCIIYPWHCIVSGYRFGLGTAASLPQLMALLIGLKCLFVLHCFWASIILRMVYAALKDGGVKGDARDVTPEPADNKTHQGTLKKGDKKKV